MGLVPEHRRKDRGVYLSVRLGEHIENGPHVFCELFVGTKHRALVYGQASRGKAA